MRDCKRNQQSFLYASLLGTVPVYKTDGYGNIEYVKVKGEDVPIDTGEKQKVCDNPICFSAVMSMAGSEAETMAFGLSMADYEAVLSYPKGSVNLKEGDMIWSVSWPEYLYPATSLVTINKKTYEIMGAKPESADYMVAKISYSLNAVKAVLKKVTK